MNFGLVTIYWTLTDDRDSRVHDEHRRLNPARLIRPFPQSGPEPSRGFRPLDGRSSRICGAGTVQYVVVPVGDRTSAFRGIKSDRGDFDVCCQGGDGSEFSIIQEKFCNCTKNIK